MPSRPMTIVLRAMRGSRLVFGLALLCVIVAAFMSLLDPLVIRFTLDSILGGGKVELPPYLVSILERLGGGSSTARALWLCALALVATSLANALFSFLRGLLSSLAAEQTVKNLRDRLAAHLDALPSSFFSRKGAGDLVQRATSDVDTVRRFLATQIEEVGRAASLLVLTVVLMATIDGPMTRLSIPIIPAVFGFSYFFFRRIQKAFKVSDEAEGALTQVLQENLHGIRVVRAFAREEQELGRFDEKNVHYTEETRRLIILFGWYWGVSIFLCAAQELVTIGFGAARVARGDLSPGTYVAFVAYVGRVLWPVRQLGRTLTEVGKALVSLGRIGEVLDAPDERATDSEAARIAVAEGGGHPPPSGKEKGSEELPRRGSRGRVEFDRVTVEYEKGKVVLRELSFAVEPGQTLAILGRTGAGKSTLAAALVRLVEPVSGRILVDGTDIRLMDREALRERVGLVLQEPYLFSRSLRGNVELGSGTLAEEELDRAARLSGLAPVVASFETSWTTEVGEEGVGLSGGQRQRLAIARVLARRPGILVLDDSLSALDTETDALVRRAIAGEVRNLTTIIVAHRITTLKEADRILVLEEGRLADIGTHDELLGRPGLYRRVWDIQSGRNMQSGQNMTEPTRPGAAATMTATGPAAADGGKG